MTTRSGSKAPLLLFSEEARLINVKCFLGDGPHTREDLRAQVESALRQRRESTATVSDRFTDDAQRIDVRALVASLQ